MLMSIIWYPLHFLRKILNGSIFTDQGRGMLWFYDSRDWLGGYPYESATKDEILDYLDMKGFKISKQETQNQVLEYSVLVVLTIYSKKEN